MTEINIYCDESCHLENDHHKVMVLGGIWCPKRKAREIADRIREIKLRHGLPATFEIKWSKVSPAKEQLYRDALDYFFDDDDLHFRAVIVPDKSELLHKEFDQDHDTWYYKMYFTMLRVLFDPECRYYIYLDIKDTRSAQKIHALHDVLANAQRDFQRTVVQRVQTVVSHEVEQIQLADLLIGAVSFANRGLEKLESSSLAKCRLVDRMRERSRYNLVRTTLYREPKVNLLRWRHREPWM